MRKKKYDEEFQKVLDFLDRYDPLSGLTPEQRALINLADKVGAWPPRQAPGNGKAHRRAKEEEPK